MRYILMKFEEDCTVIPLSENMTFHITGDGVRILKQGSEPLEYRYVKLENFLIFDTLIEALDAAKMAASVLNYPTAAQLEERKMAELQQMKSAYPIHMLNHFTGHGMTSKRTP